MTTIERNKPKLTEQVDIIEDDLLEVYGEEVFNTLLKDHTTQKNIFWATNDYEQLGEAYGYDKPILPELITGENNHIIMICLGIAELTAVPVRSSSIIFASNIASLIYGTESCMKLLRRN